MRKLWITVDKCPNKISGAFLMQSELKSQTGSLLFAFSFVVASLTTSAVTLSDGDNCENQLS